MNTCRLIASSRLAASTRRTCHRASWATRSAAGRATPSWSVIGCGVGFKPGGWLTGGLVTSDALHLTERYTRVDRDQLNYEVTIEDAKVLTKPFTQRTTLMLREGARLREYSCAENNMDPAVYEKMLKDPTASQSFIRGK